MTSQKQFKDVDYQTLQPDGTFDLSFNEITDPKRIALERILRTWMAENDQSLKSREGGVRLQERFNSLLDQGSLIDLLSNEACRVTNVTSIDISPKRHNPKNIELDATIRLSSGEVFRNLIRVLDGKVFPVELDAKDAGIKLLSGSREHAVMSEAGALIDQRMRQKGTYQLEIPSTLTAIACDCGKGNVEIKARRDLQLESILKNVRAAYLVSYKCAKDCGVADKDRQWSIPLG